MAISEEYIDKNGLPQIDYKIFHDKYPNAIYLEKQRIAKINSKGLKNSIIQFQKAMKRIFLLNRHHKNKQGNIGDMIFEMQSM